LVNTRGSREKARVAKILETHQTTHNSLGSETVGMWNFDNCTAQDASGYGNDGTISGATCNSTTPYSVFGQGSGKNSLSFDGVNDYILIPASAYFDVQKFTISAWTYSSNYSRNQFIFEKTTNGAVNTQYSCFFGGGVIYFRTYNSAGSGDDLAVAITTAGVQNNQWNLIVCAYDGLAKKIFVNGAEKASKSYSQTLMTNPNGTSVIGAYGSGTSYFFSGFIDDVRIYSQSLTQSQIQHQYAEGMETHNSLTLE